MDANLFRRVPPRVAAFWDAAKRAAREKKRAEWKAQNLPAPTQGKPKEGPR